MSRIQSVHLIGIGGCGMSAIAKILHLMGYRITGSDLKESANTIRLRELGIKKIFFGHDASNVREADLVIYSSAIALDNVEMVAARSRRVPAQPRAAALAWIMNQSRTAIAVAGTHGKTTTTSMIAQLLERTGLDPTYLIGGETNDVDGNARMGNGNFVVAEADESDGSFLELTPQMSIVTNIEEDHLDYYGTLDKIMEAFRSFLAKVPAEGRIIMNIDHENNRRILPEFATALTYGFAPDAALRAENPLYHDATSSFDVIFQNRRLGKMHLNVPGAQNVVNALAAAAVGLLLDKDFAAIELALQSFSGARRRFQRLGYVNHIMVVDDYAHHPTEIKATLSAARLGWPGKRLVAVFQPHRFTRTLYLAEQFGEAFNDADLVIITDVYSAGEAPIVGVSGEMIADKIPRSQKVHYIPRKERIPDHLLEWLQDNDLLITMGAGDIYTVGKEILGRLRQKKND